MIICSSSRLLFYHICHQQERQQKQIEDAITALVHQQEAAQVDHEHQEKRFSYLFQQLSCLSVHYSTNNGLNSNRDEDMHDETIEVPHGGDRTTLNRGL